MTLIEACRILTDLHTRPSRDYPIIVEMSRMPKRGEEDQYVEAWKRVYDFANAPGAKP